MSGAVPWEGNINLSKGRLRQLTARERRYLHNRLGTPRMEETEAYLAASQRPDGSYPCTRDTAHVSACRMEARLRARPALWQDILSAAGIDDYALAGDLNWARNAMRTEFYQGRAVADVEDNGTRMRAIELIAELLGHRKNALELSGALGLKGYVGVSPDDWDEPETPVPEPAAPPSPPADTTIAPPAPLSPDLPAGGTAAPSADPAPSATVPVPPRGLTIKYLDGTELRSHG